MVALIEKIITCFAAAISWLSSLLVRKYPLWLYIVACLGAVLLYSLIACSHDKSVTQAVVGKTEYEGHTYLVFGSITDHHTIAVVHDPDCLCNYIEPIISD